MPLHIVPDPIPKPAPDPSLEPWEQGIQELDRLQNKRDRDWKDWTVPLSLQEHGSIPDTTRLDLEMKMIHEEGKAIREKLTRLAQEKAIRASRLRTSSLGQVSNVILFPIAKVITFPSRQRQY